ncbi:MAG: hypothetical protein HQ592_08640 [Planctomycetes bacterium]|nr:hypothetical protein [Planctomycetota bacterium]
MVHSSPPAALKRQLATRPDGSREVQRQHEINRVMRAQASGMIVREHQQDQMIHAVLSFE